MHGGGHARICTRRIGGAVAGATLALTLFGATGAGAYTSSDGHDYDVTCNESGMVLESSREVSRFVGQGANTRIVTGIEKIYLGKSCDAFHTVFGAGSWGWANGGIRAEFAEYFIGFPRQELFCPVFEGDYTCNR